MNSKHNLMNQIQAAKISKDKRLLLIFIDFSKAFDSINWKVLRNILLAYQIPEKLVDSILQLYYNTVAKVKSDGILSSDININVGVLQGDTLAPYLFIIVLDYVLRKSFTEEDGYLISHSNNRTSRHTKKNY